MSTTQVVVKYDGPILADHKMDVEQVAPAMLALAELVKRANKIANGDRASVKVLANADINEHCFSFGIEIVQTLFEQAKDLLSDEDITTAIKIAEIIGLSAGAVGSLFGLLKFLNGRIPDSTTMTVRDGRDVVQIHAGRDVYYVAPETHKLYSDPDTLRDAKAVTKPVTEEGYDSVEFKGEKGTERIGRDDAQAIQESPVPQQAIETIIPPSKIRAWVKIRKAVYDGRGKWNIQYDKSRDVSMNDAEWLAKFQSNEVTAPPGSLLDVEMSVSNIELDSRGRLVRDPEYAIEKVHDVDVPENLDLFDGEDKNQPQGGDQDEEA